VAQIKSLEDLEKLREKVLAGRDPRQKVITVCAGTGCRAYGCEEVINAFGDEIKKQGLTGKVGLMATGCHGFCEMGPVLIIRPDNTFYHSVKVEDVAEIVTETVVKGNIIDRLLYTDPASGQKVVREGDVPFYKKQNRQVFGNNGYIDPGSIEDYLAVGGYAALAKALTTMKPQQVVNEVKLAGLRGRGGGGFNAGDKWQSTRDAAGDARYLVCNADEGDPGAYMDRSLLEGNPHSVIEGMIIAAYAIGSHDGYIYVRNEYPLAVQNALVAIKQAGEMGLLGKNILGSGFDFNIAINRGGGAFVCGESTALMASMEGKVGEPRAKYVHSSEVGLWEQPTVLNNVETYANVPLIIRDGAAAYAKVGTAGSKGTKIFSLVGKINNTGLVEVPMGTTLREIIFGIGGGIPGGKKFKAVQTGGPSGGCIPESQLDLPVDFDALAKVGSMMGSGGMIVMDETTCMVDIAKYFINFLEEESCGKCVPCREGLKQMGIILKRITEGKGKDTDIDLLETMCTAIEDGALCALGSTAPNPVLSTIRYFRDEYEAHIKEQRCPAGVCKALITYSIVDENCIGCGRCFKVCPADAITDKGKKVPAILDEKKCIRCGACYDVCRLNAIKVQ